GLLIVAETGGRDFDGDADELADGVDDLGLGPDLLVHAPAGRAPIAPDIDQERTGLVASGLPNGVGEGLPVNGLSRGCDQGSGGGEEEEGCAHERSPGQGTITYGGADGNMGNAALDAERA